MSTHKEYLIQKLIENGGLKVRQSQNDQPFWYTSGLPGPYYLNTEFIIGENESDSILSKITESLNSTPNYKEAIKTIRTLILTQYRNDKEYQKIISCLIDYYKYNHKLFPEIISGGERRDWFFSIPFAAELDLPHIYLFKSKDLVFTDNIGNFIDNQTLTNKEVLHISDIINKASSYTRTWIPTLKKSNISLKETLSVGVRDQEGIDNLNIENVSIISPLRVDVNLFETAHKLKLISAYTLEDIKEYTYSPRKWTKGLLLNIGEDLLNPFSNNVFSHDRIISFFNNDIYKLQAEIPHLFEVAKVAKEKNAFNRF
jgi:hypothetical protein